MIDQLVTQCFRRRGIMMLVFALFLVFGCYCWSKISLEAYPDIAPVTSQVITQVNGLAAAEVEQQITIPLERALLATPGVSVLRSRSTFGLSLITVVFREGTDNYWSRERLLEKISQVSLPYNATPGLDPLTSPIGEIYRYTINSKIYNIRELSELQFWKVIPRLKQVPGVVEITNFGGVTTQLLLEIDPLKLSKYQVSLADVKAAIVANNQNAGGSILTHGEQAIVIRGVGLVHDLKEFGNIKIKQINGIPVYVKDLGVVRLGHKQRRGIVGKDNQSDVIEGIVQMLKGENPSKVIEGIHAAIEDLNQHILPKGVKIEPYIDRSELVHATIDTVGETLLYGMSLVTLVLLFFLGSIRAALIVAITIPIALVTAFICMYNFDVPANLLSLGAIDFGIIVDGAIVVTENILRRREEKAKAQLSESEVLTASLQVTHPIFFGILVIITAYSVLFAFQEIEYKLFAPMAFAVGFALLGALMVALFLIPGLAYKAYHNPVHIYSNPVLTWLKPRYGDVLNYLIGRSKWVLGIYFGALGLVILLGTFIGRDFLPYLDEGSLWLQVTLPPGISLDKASAMADDLRKATLEFPEISHIVTQVGRNDDGTDSFTPAHIECAVALHPYTTWPRGMNKQKLIALLAERYRKLAGTHVAFTQPMIDGVLDKVAGAHSDLVVKIYGNDMVEMRKIATSVVGLLHQIPGAEGVIIDQEPPMTELRIEVDRHMIARQGIDIADVMDVIQTGIGGQAISQIYIEERSYDLTARFPKENRSSPEEIGRLLLKSSTGALVSLSKLAKIYYAMGQTTITHEMMHRQLTVRLNLRGRDLLSFSREVTQKIAEKIPYNPTEYQIILGGQLENQQRAQARFKVIIPMLLGLMFVLLFVQFGNLRHPGLILLTVPLAMLGGLFALLMRGMTLNVSSAVGFIALFGVVILNAIIMIANLNRWQRKKTPTDLKESIIGGAQERLRPVLMTATVAAIGMIPAALKHGLGSDVQRPLATVIVGGLISATALTLLLLPALYYWIEEQTVVVRHKWMTRPHRGST